jgi:two-component system CheB/CheR fusion protein
LTIESRIILETFEGRRLALESTRDVTDRKVWEEKQKLLLGELTHRVKNILAVVQAIARQTLRRSRSNEDFIERLDGRLFALAGAHSILVETDWHGADLATLANRLLEPYTSDNSDRFHISGEPIFLPADLATPFGQVFHELATNATKHGALSRQSGIVDLSWTLAAGDNERLLTVVWRESRGPPVKQPKSSGFGTALIEKGIPNATVGRDFRSDGFVCTLKVPLPNARDP